MKKMVKVFGQVLMVVCVLLMANNVLAAEKLQWRKDISPTKARPQAEREAYFPGTEDLGKDEMRIFACGTGMPTARPKQAATCFLVELGNGDKFVFDMGTGST